MNTLTENMIVIHDSSPNTFNIWIFAMCAIFLVYFFTTTIHDIKRETKLEKLKKEMEEKREKHDLDEI